MGKIYNNDYCMVSIDTANNRTEWRVQVKTRKAWVVRMFNRIFNPTKSEWGDVETVIGSGNSWYRVEQHQCYGVDPELQIAVTMMVMDQPQQIDMVCVRYNHRTPTNPLPASGVPSTQSNDGTQIFRTHLVLEIEISPTKNSSVSLRFRSGPINPSP